MAAFFAVDGFGLASWATRLPAVKASHHLSSGKLGLILFAIACGATLSMGGTGALALRLGSLRTLYIAGATYLAGLALLAQPGGRWPLALTALFFGVGFGAMNVALNAHAIGLEGAVARPVMSRLHAAFSGGGLLGALVGGLASASRVSPPLHLAIVAAVGAVIYLCAAPALSIVDARASGGPLLARPQGALVALGIIAFCSLLGEGAAADWSAVFLRSSAGASRAVAAFGYLGFSLAMAFGRLTGDWMIGRFGAARPMRASAGTAAVGLTIALVAGTTPLGVLGFTLLGLGLATVVPNTFRAAARATSAAPAAGVAAVSTLGWLGFMIGPPVIGGIASVTSLPLALGLVVIAVSTIAALAPRLEPAAGRAGTSASGLTSPIPG